MLKPFHDHELVTSIDRVLYKRAMEARLHDNEARFRALIENGPDITVVVDERFSVRYITPSVERVLGYSVNELVGEKLTAAIHPDDMPGVLEKLEQSLNLHGRSLLRRFACAMPAGRGAC